MILKQLRIAAAIVLVSTATCLTAGIVWALGPRPVPQAPAISRRNTEVKSRIAAGEKKAGNQQVQARGVVVDEAGRLVAGAHVQAAAYTNREADGVTEADGSFAISVERRQLNGMPLLARTTNPNRAGIFQYDLYPTKEQEHVRARIVLKPTREVAIRVADTNNAPVSGASVEIAGSFSVFDDTATGRDGTARLQVPVDAKVEWIIALKSAQGFDYAEFGRIDEAGRTQGGSPAAELPAAVSLTLDGTRIVHIKAVDRNRNPLAGVDIRAMADTETRPPQPD